MTMESSGWESGMPAHYAESPVSVIGSANSANQAVIRCSGNGAESAVVCLPASFRFSPYRKFLLFSFVVCLRNRVPGVSGLIETEHRLLWLTRRARRRKYFRKQAKKWGANIQYCCGASAGLLLPRNDFIRQFCRFDSTKEK